MANQTIYPYGQNGELPSNIGLVNDFVTGGADKALTAECGKTLYQRLFIGTNVFWQNSSTTNWITGNIYNGRIETSYANKYIIISNFPQGVSTINITRVAPDSTYTLSVYGSSNGTNFTTLTGFGTSSGTKTYTLGNYDRIALLLWDKPSTERARQEEITITYTTESEVLNESDVIDNLSSQSTTQPLSANQGRELNNNIIEIRGGIQQYPMTWSTGNIESNGDVTSYANQITDYITLETNEAIFSNPTSYTIKICLYNNETFIGLASGVSANTTATRTFSNEVKFIRLCVYEKPSASAVLPIVISYILTDTLATLKEDINELYLSINKRFSNPVLKADKPDPSVINGEDGYYYMLCTGTLATNKMYRSTNLVDWEIADSPFTSQAISDCYEDLGVSSVNMWAPEIVKVGNKYNLYTSKTANPMIVFQSDHPNFGYEYIGQIITTSNGLSTDNIDACVRYDLDGSLWMFWGSTNGIYRQKLTNNGLSLDETDTKVHVAGRLLSQDSSRMTVFEGAYLYRKKGYWYLFVSAGLYSNYTYCLKVGRSETLTGTFVDQNGNDMAEGNATTILSSSSGATLYGPGHNGIIITDRNNRTFAVYHSHYTGASNSSQRYVCLQEMFWDDETGWPYFTNGSPKLDRNNFPNL